MSDVEVGRVGDEAGADQLADGPLAEALDVHRAPRRPVDDPGVHAGRGTTGSTQRVSASPSGRTNGSPQAGHVVGNTHGFGPVRAQREHRPDDLGDHVAGLAHDHRVARPHVLRLHLVLVVQRRHADRRAADEHRLEHGERRRPPGAADRHLDVAQHGGALLGRELVGDRPARRPRREPELLALVDVVDLHDDTVDLVAEVVAVLLPVLAVGEHVVERREHLHLGVHREPERAEERQRLGVRGERRHALDLTELVRPERQVAVGGDRRVLLAQAARRGVARVHEQPRARGLGRLVEPLEAGHRHVHLAADLEHVGHR